jgi:hypothetical protein
MSNKTFVKVRVLFGRKKYVNRCTLFSFNQFCGGKQGIFLQNCPIRMDEFSGHYVNFGRQNGSLQIIGPKGSR